jgi:hypothetical protein
MCFQIGVWSVARQLREVGCQPQALQLKLSLVFKIGQVAPPGKEVIPRIPDRVVSVAHTTEWLFNLALSDAVTKPPVSYLAGAPAHHAVAWA